MFSVGKLGRSITKHVNVFSAGSDENTSQKKSTSSDQFYTKINRYETPRLHNIRRNAIHQTGNYLKNFTLEFPYTSKLLRHEFQKSCRRLKKIV